MLILTNKEWSEEPKEYEQIIRQGDLDMNDFELLSYAAELSENYDEEKTLIINSEHELFLASLINLINLKINNANVKYIFNGRQVGRKRFFNKLWKAWFMNLTRYKIKNKNVNIRYATDLNRITEDNETYAIRGSMGISDVKKLIRKINNTECETIDIYVNTIDPAMALRGCVKDYIFRKNVHFYIEEKEVGQSVFYKKLGTITQELDNFFFGC